MKHFQAIVLLLLLTIPAIASPDEASGRVTHIVDGDTVDVSIQEHGSQVTGDLIRVRFADIDTPEMDTPQGPVAKAYTAKWLEGSTVFLDIDNLQKMDNYGRYVAIVYLTKPDGSLENFNRKLVDEGQACIWDFSDNEFSPASWWDGTIPTTACVKSDSSSSGPAKPFVGASSAWAGPGQGSKQGMESSQNYFEQGSSQNSPYSSGVGSIGSSYASSSDGPFVGSAKSDKYHYPSCSAAQRIKSSNLVTFSSSEEARASGYVPCQICHPP